MVYIILNITVILREKRRAKRGGHRKNYKVEVVVAVDQVLEKRYGKKTKKYVQSVMSKASNLYSKSNIGESISLSVVKIIYIKNKMGGSKKKVKGKFRVE